MIKAVIFDRDGVLLDSEYTNIRAGELAFQELGITLTEEEKRSIVGRHPDDYAKPLIAKYGVDYDKFRELQRSNYFEVLESTPIFEKTIQLLRDIHAHGIAVALCTSSRIESTVPLLEKLGIRDLFQVLVGKEDYTNRKPDPEPYQVTAKKLGVNPADCLVIEDSEVGMRSALGAGMRCIVIFNDHTKDHDFSGAWRIVDSAAALDLSEILG